MTDSDTVRRIRLALAQKGWRESRLAKEIGMTRQNLYEIMSGKRPGLTRIPAIAKKLDVSAEWLNSGINPPSWASDAPLGSASQIEALRRELKLQEEINALQAALLARDALIRRREDENAALRSAIARLEQHSHGRGNRSGGRKPSEVP